MGEFLLSAIVMMAMPPIIPFSKTGFPILLSKLKKEVNQRVLLWIQKVIPGKMPIT